MAASPLVPVILCGGTGTRLWPLSRASYPKQYWALAGEHTLLQQTQERLSGIADLGPPLLICNEDHRFIVAEQMRQIGVDPAAILLEPVGRNTAPAIAVAALQATARGEDPLLLVLAADHVIRDCAAFRAAITAAHEVGLRPKAFFMVGHMPDTRETILETIEFAKTLPLHDVTVQINTLLPETPQMEMWEREGEKWGRLVNQTNNEKSFWEPTFVPWGLEPDELIELHRRAARLGH
jgi:mannose-1-phosphate guanylyltransferase